MAYGVATGAPIGTGTWSSAQRDDYYQRIKAAGFTKVRFDITAAGAGDIYELHVTSALNAGLKILGIILLDPTFTTTSYSTRCTAVANKYRASIFEWELGNEPNLQSWASGNAYAAVAKAGSDAIKASYAAGALPAPTLVLGGISNHGSPGNTSVSYPPTWLTSIYTLAAGHAWFDHVNYHPYGFGKNFTGAQAFGSTSGWQIMADTSPSLRSVMISNGDSAKKIYVTEHGGATWSDGTVSTDWPATTASDPVGMTEQAVADFLQLSLDDWQTRSWAGDFYVYSFKDRWADVPSTAATREGHFGLTRSNFSQKPAYAVMVAEIGPAPAPPPVPQTITTRAAARGPITVPNIIVTRAAARGPVTADTTAPTVSLTAPTAGASVSGNVTISATATDNVQVALVEFLVDGLVVNSDATSPYSISWNSATATNGSHTITARATDTSGNQATSAARTVTVTGGLAAGVPHRSELFPAITLEVDFPDDTLAIPYPAQLLATISSDSAHPLPSAYYRLQEPSGTSYAEAQGKTAGTTTGTVLYHQSSPVGPDDYAIKLVSGAVFAGGVAYSSTLSDLTPVGITMCGWFKMDTVGSTQRLIWNLNSSAVVLKLGSDGLLWITTTGSDSNPAKGTTVISAGEWFFAALVIGAPTGGDPNDPVPQGTARAYLMKLSDLTIRKEVTGLQRFVDGWEGQGPRFGGSASSSLYVDEPAYWTGNLTQQALAEIGYRANPNGFVYPNYTWTDLSAKVRAIDSARGRAAETERVASGETSATLEDTTRRLEPDYPGSDLYPNVVPQRIARWRATKDAVTYDLARFYVETWPVDWTLRRGIASIRGADLMGVLGTWTLGGKYVQQLTGARINVYLDRIGWPAAARLIDAGTATMVTETLVAANALAQIQLAADTENGLFFVDGAGNAVFHDANHRATAARSITAQAVYGDGGPATNELPYVSAPLDLPDGQIWNSVSVTFGTVTDEAHTVTVGDAVSQRRYGVRALPTRETRLVNAAAATAQANAILARYKDPHVRFASVTIDPQRYPGLWAAVLGHEISDRVTVKRRPYAGGAAVVKDAWIERIRHSAQVPNDGRNKWQTVLEVTTV
jgi:Bacterial Ig domain